MRMVFLPVVVEVCMRVIRRIGVLSLGKLMGISMAGFSLVIGIIYAIFILLFSVVGAAGMVGAGGNNAALGGGLGMGMGILMAAGMVTLFPLLYGFFGFVFGMLYGLILNLALRVSGGLEFEVGEREEG